MNKEDYINKLDNIDTNSNKILKEICFNLIICLVEFNKTSFYDKLSLNKKSINIKFNKYSSSNNSILTLRLDNIEKNILKEEYKNSLINIINVNLKILIDLYENKCKDQIIIIEFNSTNKYKNNVIDVFEYKSNKIVFYNKKHNSNSNSLLNNVYFIEAKLFIKDLNKEHNSNSINLNSINIEYIENIIIFIYLKCGNILLNLESNIINNYINNSILLKSNNYIRFESKFFDDFDFVNIHINNNLLLTSDMYDDTSSIFKHNILNFISFCNINHFLYLKNNIEDNNLISTIYIETGIIMSCTNKLSYSILFEKNSFKYHNTNNNYISFYFVDFYNNEFFKLNGSRLHNLIHKLNLTEYFSDNGIIISKIYNKSTANNLTVNNVNKINIDIIVNTKNLKLLKKVLINNLDDNIENINIISLKNLIINTLLYLKQNKHTTNSCLNKNEYKDWKDVEIYLNSMSNALLSYIKISEFDDSILYNPNNNKNCNIQEIINSLDIHNKEDINNLNNLILKNTLL